MVLMYYFNKNYKFHYLTNKLVIIIPDVIFRFFYKTEWYFYNKNCIKKFIFFFIRSFPISNVCTNIMRLKWKTKVKLYS